VLTEDKRLDSYGGSFPWNDQISSSSRQRIVEYIRKASYLIPAGSSQQITFEALDLPGPLPQIKMICILQDLSVLNVKGSHPQAPYSKDTLKLYAGSKAILRFGVYIMIAPEHIIGIHFIK